MDIAMYKEEQKGRSRNERNMTSNRKVADYADTLYGTKQS